MTIVVIFDFFDTFAKAHTETAADKFDFFAIFDSAHAGERALEGQP